MPTDWKLRVAAEGDIGAIKELIPLSVRIPPRKWKRRSGRPLAWIDD